MLDVAVIQSVVKKGGIDDRVGEYGHLIVDECHHVSAQSFEWVVRHAKARFVTGLWASRLAAIPRENERVILATGKYGGEGFDDPRQDTLFLTLPVSGRGTIDQYAGRLHRLYDGKREVRRRAGSPRSFPGDCNRTARRTWKAGPPIPLGAEPEGRRALRDLEGLGSPDCGHT